MTAATLSIAATSPVSASARRKSPNRRRAVARVFIWNFALAAVAVALPVLF